MSRLARQLLSLFVLVAAVNPVCAQEPPAKLVQDPETTVEALQARLDATKADATLADEAKAPIVELLTRAVENAKTVSARLDAVQNFEALRASVSTRLAEAQRKLRALDDGKAGPQQPGLTLAQLEQGFADAQKRQQAAQQQAAGFETERANRTTRRKEIPDQLAALRQQLAALPPQPADSPEVDVRLSTARRLATRTERNRLQAEIDAATAELASYDADNDVLRAEGDLAARSTIAAKADAEAWLAVLQPLRELEAERAATAARQEAARADPQIAPIAEENARLARIVAGLTFDRARTESEMAARKQELTDLQQQFKEIENRVNLVGSDERIGTLLRKQRALLAAQGRDHQKRIRSRRDRIITAQLEQVDYEERRRRVVEDRNGWLQSQLKEGQTVAVLSPEVQAAAQDFVTKRLEVLQQLIDGYGGLLDNEIAIENTESELTKLIASYRTYVTERVLGIRSANPIWAIDLQSVVAAATWLTDAGSWVGVIEATATLLLAEIWPLAVVLLLVLLGGLGFRLRRRQITHGELAATGTNVAYLPTALAAIDSLLLVLPLPAILLLWGWRLGAQHGDIDFQKAIAASLVDGGLGIALVSALRVMVLPQGLGESHFQWQTTTIQLLRKSVPPLFLVVGMTFVFSALQAHGNDEWLGSLGTLVLAVQLSLLTLVFWRLLHPSAGIIGGRFKPIPGPIYRFRSLWFVLAAGLPASLLVMTVLGYEYTANALERRVFYTGTTMMLAVLLHALILRGLLLERRRLQIQRAQARQQAVKAGDTAAEADAGSVPDPQLLARQTQALLAGVIVIAVAVAVYQIWVDVLPALRLLRGVELWNIGTESAKQWITLADVLLAAFLLTASFAAARNLPALLELFVLQRLTMGAGERNAITTLARYGIIIVGVLWSFGSIGVGWSKVQWLIAAVSVGLGFGLQEIFANFVSGLILLFERPMRVGDLVTVSDTTGRVARIQIRATTILDWTRKELVVPNREFVTGRFVNWTLGDSIVRYTVKVGVAYGTDTQLAIRLLNQAAIDCPRILKDPEPNAYFVQFGDSTLDLELRLFIDIDKVEWHWVTDIHQAIDKAFREAGIVIAFPQRDVHLTVPDSLVAGLSGRDGPPVAG